MRHALMPAKTYDHTEHAIWNHNGNFPYDSSAHFHDHLNFGLLSFVEEIKTEDTPSLFSPVSAGGLSCDPNPFNPVSEIVFRCPPPIAITAD